MILYGSPSAVLEVLPPAEPAAWKSETREGLRLAREFLEEGGSALYFGGPGYPEALAALGEPPPVLFVRGEAGALSPPGGLVAVVGARELDEGGRGAATEAAR